MRCSVVWWGQRGSKGVHDIHDWTVEYGRRGKPFRPGRTGGIDRREVPQMPVTVATLLNWLGRPRILLHLRGQQMIRVPELPRAPIREPAQYG